MSKSSTSNIESFKQAIEKLEYKVSYHNLDQFNVLGCIPSAVITPSNIKELSKTLTTANERKLSVSPRGGGTKLELGNTPDSLDIVIDMSGLDKILNHAPGDLTATVESGITISNLQNELAEHGQFLAIDPALPHIATVGGVLATGIAGPMKWQHGNPRDTVIGMKIVSPNGTITKSGGQVVKNVSGYDMSRLHIGGLGTLGIIAEVSFKLTPLPPKEITIITSFNSNRIAAEVALEVFDSNLMPLAITVFDTDSHDQIPDIGIHNPVLAIRIAGRPATIERYVKDSTSIINKFGSSNVEILDQIDSKPLWERISNFGWNTPNSETLLCRISVLPSAVPDLIESIEKFEYDRSLIGKKMSHPAYGTVLVEWHYENGPLNSEMVSTVLDTFSGLVQRLDGSLVIQRCPGKFREGIDIWGKIGSSLGIMRRLKKQYDPNRTINPGRFIGGI